MEKILLATQNQGKVREFRKLLAPLGLTIVTPADLAETIEVIEDQNTFAGNAFKKAMTFFQLTGLPTIADDSGLAVDYIDGRPGVFSARYSGEQATDASNNAKLLFELDGVPMEERTARFTSAIAFVLSADYHLIVEGHTDGLILPDYRGQNGFGYDALFLIPHLNKTYAELDDEEKNAISHRGVAMRKLYAKLPSILS